MAVDFRRLVVNTGPNTLVPLKDKVDFPTNAFVVKTHRFKLIKVVSNGCMMCHVTDEVSEVVEDSPFVVVILSSVVILSICRHFMICLWLFLR